MEQELKKLGFKRKWLYDKSGFWFEKSFKFIDLKFVFSWDTDQELGDVVIEYKKDYMELGQFKSFKQFIKTYNSYADTIIKK